MTGPVTPKIYRNGMARVAGAVHVVTTGGRAGRAGFTASAVVSVSDDPGTLLVCLNKVSRVGPLIAENGIICVNTLAVDQREIAEIFAGRTDIEGDARFSHGYWQAGTIGAPVLTDALAAFEARIIEMRPVATHHAIFAEVATVSLGPARPPLLYFDRAYHTLG